MQKQQPDVIHGYETAVHDSFLRSLVFCSNQDSGLDGPYFTQCIKAAGINFATSYEQFFDMKKRRQQAMLSGHIE